MARPASANLSDVDSAHPSVKVHGPEAGPLVVLVHGTPDTSGAFAQVLTHLADLRVITYDRRGFGRSVHLPPPLTMAHHAADLLAIVDQCAEQHGRPPVVVAHSFGSNPTMLAAIERPTALAAVGLWEPPTCWVDWWVQSTKDHNQRVANAPDPGAEMEDSLRRLLGNTAWEAMPPATQARRRAEGTAYALDMASILDAPFDFAKVAVPAVVGRGSETAPEHHFGAEWLVEQLPDAELYDIGGAGHFANRTHPAEFAGFVRAACARAHPQASISTTPQPS